MSDENNEQNNNYPEYNNNYNQEAPKPKNNALSIVSLVTGILSFIFMCCCTYLGIALGIVAIVCAIFHYRSTKSFNVMSILGMIFGGLGIVLSIVAIFFTYAGGDNSLYNQIMRAVEDQIKEQTSTI